jgi:predicted AlkP superfamily phosphohydrolase/phosphomutase
MKTAIIGLDGATFDIILPLAKAGRMPVLSRLMREGCHAPLRSTILPNSFPGWASCTTGTSEGMHGVFSPFIKNEGSYSVKAMSGLDIKTRPIWDVLSLEGGRSVVLNVPTTYPAEEINGLMVTGMLTPGINSDFSYPRSLKGELLAAVPDYIIEPERIPDRLARANEFRRTIEVREKALSFLLARGEWDFLMVVFSILDRAQHDYWADMDSSHPRHDSKVSAALGDFINEIYQRLDAAVGRLIEKLPSHCRVFVVSDHGFCAELFEVRVNEALAQSGLLTFKSGSTRQSRARVRSLREKISRRLSPEGVQGNVLEKKVHFGSGFIDEIDWSKTRAFFAQDKGVWVNLIDRESNGIVSPGDYRTVCEEARQALLDIKSPADGVPVFGAVMTREEAFTGDWRRLLPDLVMVPSRDEFVYNERPSYRDVVVPADSTTGTHSRDGIFIAWGSGIAPGVVFDSKPNLRDVGPTALASLGCPLTEDMDGRVLTEAFCESPSIARRGSSYREQSADAESIYTAVEESDLRDRLRALGYIK